MQLTFCSSNAHLCDGQALTLPVVSLAGALRGGIREEVTCEEVISEVLHNLDTIFEAPPIWRVGSLAVSNSVLDFALDATVTCSREQRCK